MIIQNDTASTEGFLTVYFLFCLLHKSPEYPSASPSHDQRVRESIIG